MAPPAKPSSAAQSGACSAACPERRRCGRWRRVPTPSPSKWRRPLTRPPCRSHADTDTWRCDVAWTIYARHPLLLRHGELDFASFEATVRFCAVGTWEMVLDARSPLAEQMVLPGC